MPATLPPGEGPRERKQGFADFLRKPSTVIGVLIGIFLLLILYVAFQSELEGPFVAGRRRFLPNSNSPPSASDSTLSDSLPRQLKSSLPFAGGGMELVRTDKMAAPARDVSESAKRILASEGPLSEAEGNVGESSRTEGAAEGQDSEEDGELGRQPPQPGQGEGGVGAAAGAAGQFGARNNSSIGGLSGRGGGGGNSGSTTLDNSRLARASGPSGSSAAGGRSTPPSGGAVRPFQAASVRGGGPGGVGGGAASGRNQARGLNTNAPGGAPRFVGSPGGIGSATGASVGGGAISAAGSSPIEGGGGGVGGGATGPGVGTQNPGGGEGGGIAAGGNVDNEIAAYGDAVSDFENQNALVEGQNYIECLIRAFGRRYTRARDQVDQLTRDVDRAIVYFQSDFPSAATVHTLTELKNNLVGPTGLRTSLQNSVTKLGEGEICFKEDQKGQDAACYDKWQGPIIGLDLTIMQINGFHTLVGTEGTAAMSSLGGQVLNNDPSRMCPAGMHPSWYPHHCHYPSRVEDARDYLQTQITGYQTKLNAAKDDLSGLRWGNEAAVLELAIQYRDARYGPYKSAKKALNDIESGSLPAKKQEGWRNAQTTSNLTLEKANTAWNQISRENTQQKKIAMFVEAHRETRYAAGDLVRGAGVLGIRAGPSANEPPSPQFSPVTVMNVDACDVPPAGGGGGGNK